MENNHNLSKKKLHTPSAFRIKLIIPSVFFIVTILFLLTISLFYFQSNNQNNNIFEKRFTRTKSISGDFYKYNIESDAKAIQAIMTSLRVSKELSSIFATKDRKKILEYVTPLYIELNHDYNITHFYFSDLNRVNIMRAHAPDRYGDTINRVTTLNSESNRSVAYGVELGKLGTLTLRVVSPWYSDDGTQIGYFELGMEIDHIISRLERILDFNIELFIHKQYLQKDTWNEGMAVLGRNIDWQQFDSLVPTKQIINPIFRSFINSKDENKTFFGGSIKSYKKDGSTFWLLSVPISDIEGRNVANLLMLADTTFETDVTQKTIITVGLIIFVLASLLLIAFLRQINKIITHIALEESLLNKMANKDSLTNLYTRRVFDESLRREIKRSESSKYTFSILLIDIDHFKNVNDSYGHHSGDIALKIVSKIILDSCRDTDIVCRYGGEEFIVIAKSRDSQEVKVIAERIRESIQSTTIDIGNQRLINITISAGISSCGDNKSNDFNIVAAADRALYRAKSAGRNCIRIA
ncbi:MAG: GGDEF domain-containing protein [Kangiellaceae bacterium]|nr:GGDEF domain-containing protein [Kangiellaceae bacterium]